ncbi:MAG: UDP-N-acetylmuramoyl-L-alanine--D-glutamate ligase, partial [Pseudomonadota bacterium]
QYFLKKGIAFEVLEENKTCANLALLNKTKFFHEMSASQLQTYEVIYLSPGVNPNTERYISVKDKLSNDLNLFTEHCKKPFIAITGSNGKSTLVHLLEAALRAAGHRAIAIGNNSVPMLDHVDDDVDYFILELSSYQLELAKPFLCEVAYVSNISQDHLDRHGSIEHYAAIKATLYQNCRYAVINEDDQFCKKMAVKSEKISKIIAQPMNLKIIGQHNFHNALAVMAIIDLLKVDKNLALKGIEAFPGLEHRCEFVLEKNSVTWWNDSKGTNVASTITAIDSLTAITSGKLIILLGGQGKGQDFSELAAKLRDKTRAVILFGECKKELEKLFVKDWAPAYAGVAVVVVEALEEAVESAKKYAQPGDAVLLSPACASLDMFKNYEDRGRQFKAMVKND